MSIGNLLDVASRAMDVYQDAISVTGENITNVNNTDYSRQNVVLSSNVTIGGQGDGVKIADIQRVRDALIDTRFKTTSQYYLTPLKNQTHSSKLSRFLMNLQLMVSQHILQIFLIHGAN